MRVFSSCATRSTSARRICRAAAGAGTTVTVDMEDHTLTAATLAIVTALRADFPGTGAVLQARLRRTGTYELQMLRGVRPVEQRRLAAADERVRVYVPYGEEWYDYLVRRLAERPQNLSLFLTSLISEK